MAITCTRYYHAANMDCPSVPQSARCSVQCGASGHHIVDQHHAFAGDMRLLQRINCEGCVQVVQALLARQLRLRQGGQYGAATHWPGSCVAPDSVPTAVPG